MRREIVIAALAGLAGVSFGTAAWILIVLLFGSGYEHAHILAIAAAALGGAGLSMVARYKERGGR